MVNTLAPSAGDPGSTPGQGSRSHAATKTSFSQINKLNKRYFKKIRGALTLPVIASKNLCSNEETDSEYDKMKSIGC